MELETRMSGQSKSETMPMIARIWSKKHARPWSPRPETASRPDRERAIPNTGAMGALSAMKGQVDPVGATLGPAGSWSLYSPSGTPAPVLAPWTSCWGKRAAIPFWNRPPCRRRRDGQTILKGYPPRFLVILWLCSCLKERFHSCGLCSSPLGDQSA